MVPLRWRFSLGTLRSDPSTVPARSRLSYWNRLGYMVIEIDCFISENIKNIRPRSAKSFNLIPVLNRSIVLLILSASRNVKSYLALIKLPCH